MTSSLLKVEKQKQCFLFDSQLSLMKPKSLLFELWGWHTYTSSILWTNISLWLGYKREACHHWHVTVMEYLYIFLNCQLTSLSYNRLQQFTIIRSSQLQLAVHIQYMHMYIVLMDSESKDAQIVCEWCLHWISSKLMHDQWYFVSIAHSYTCCSRSAACSWMSRLITKLMLLP